MAENLEARAWKAVLKIEKKTNSIPNIEKRVIDIDNVVRDLSMKLCHIIRRKGDYYSLPDGIDYDAGPEGYN